MVKNQQSTSNGIVKDGVDATTMAGNDEQQELAAYDEGSDEEGEGGKGNGDGG